MRLSKGGRPPFELPPGAALRAAGAASRGGAFGASGGRRKTDLALAVLCGLLLACGGGEGDRPPGSATGPTIVVAGDGVPVVQMTDALADLCTARDEAPDRPRAAEARFFERSHATLHVVARALEDVDRPLAARLLEAKQKVEADFSGLASGDRVADDIGALLAVARDGLDRLAVPVPPCAK